MEVAQCDKAREIMMLERGLQSKLCRFSRFGQSAFYPNDNLAFGSSFPQLSVSLLHFLK